MSFGDLSKYPSTAFLSLSGGTLSGGLTIAPANTLGGGTTGILDIAPGGLTQRLMQTLYVDFGGAPSTYPSLEDDHYIFSIRGLAGTTWEGTFYDQHVEANYVGIVEHYNDYTRQTPWANCTVNSSTNVITPSAASWIDNYTFS